MSCLQIVTAILVIGSPSFASLLTTPTHTGDTFGTTDVILECSSDQGQRSINWTFAPLDAASNIPIIVVIAGAVTANYETAYKVVQSSPGSSDLMVNVLSNETMGTYTCSDGSVDASALLLALPFYISAQPLFGPMAGGTDITIEGIDLIKLGLISQDALLLLQMYTPTAAFFGRSIVSTSVWSSVSASSLSINALTPPVVNEDWIGQRLPIVLEFTDVPANISINRAFTYRGNPEITGIYPNEFLLTGGTRMSVYGTNLTSVSEPLISVTVVVSRANISSPLINTSIESCSVANKSLLICPLPPVNVPDDFLAILDGHFNQSDGGKDAGRSLVARSIDLHVLDHPRVLSRRKRSASVLTVTGSNGIDKLEIYIGFTLDGYMKYENINNQLPDTRLEFYTPPEIVSSKEVLKFDPQQDEEISIMGKYMTRGCRMDDYDVSVGGEHCVNFDITDNRLRCTPPKTQPQLTYNDSIFCDHTMAIIVNIGNLRFHYACLQYTSAGINERSLPLIIGLSVGLSLFVILLIVGIFLAVTSCRRKRRNRQSRKLQANRYDQTQQTQKRSADISSISQFSRQNEDNSYDTSLGTGNTGEDYENFSEIQNKAI